MPHYQPDGEDEYADAFEPWMRPTCEADLFLMDVRAEEAQRRADRVVKRVQAVLLCRQAAERTWAAILKNLAPLRYR